MCDCAAKIVQIFLFIVNFLVWITSIVLIGVGAYALAEASKYEVIFGDADTLSSVAGFTIGVGVIIFIVGFCGCCGAIKKSGCLLKIYFALVLFVLILEIIAGILAFAFKDQLIDAVGEGIEKAIGEYTGEKGNAATEAIDELQKQFDCCGANGPQDWANATMFTSAKFPQSCCVNANTDCTMAAAGSADVIQTGCVTGMQAWLEDNYIMVGGVCLGLIVFEVLALLFACCLIRAGKDDD